MREIAKFHAISFCLDRSSAAGARLGERYCLLASDSVYRADTVQVLGYRGQSGAVSCRAVRYSGHQQGDHAGDGGAGRAGEDVA